MAGLVGSGDAIAAETSPSNMSEGKTLSERAARNLALARSVYDIWASGYTEGMTVNRSVLRDAIADDMVRFSPAYGELRDPAFIETLSDENATMEFRAWWKAFPDMRMDKFRAFPTDDGVAFYMRMGGHASANGIWREMWECTFWTINDDGKIIRFEVFFLGKDIQEMWKLALGLSGPDLTPEGYWAAIRKYGAY